MNKYIHIVVLEVLLLICIAVERNLTETQLDHVDRRIGITSRCVFDTLRTV